MNIIFDTLKTESCLPGSEIDTDHQLLHKEMTNNNGYAKFAHPFFDSGKVYTQ